MINYLGLLLFASLGELDVQLHTLMSLEGLSLEKDIVLTILENPNATYHHDLEFILSPKCILPKLQWCLIILLLLLHLDRSFLSEQESIEHEHVMHQLDYLEG